MLNGLRRFYQWYNNRLNTKPLSTKMVTFAVLSALGDITCQQIENRSNKEKKDYSWTRTLRLATCYGLGVAPGVHFWYSKVIFKLWPKETIANITKAVIIDSTIVSGQSFAVFLAFMNYTDGKNIEEIKQIFRENYIKTIPKYWNFWIPVAIVNFSIVPNHYRTIVISFCSFIWTIYLSYLQSNIEKKKLQEKQLKESTPNLKLNAL